LIWVGFGLIVLVEGVDGVLSGKNCNR